MAKVYHQGIGARTANLLFTTLGRLGRGRGYRHVLTVTGRKSGRPHSLPVDVMSDGQHRWLVAPYGVTNWVLNARTAGSVELRRGRHQETFRVVELSAEEAIPVLRQYLREVPVTRAYFDITLDSTDTEVRTEARHHPVFELLPVTS